MVWQQKSLGYNIYIIKHDYSIYCILSIEYIIGHSTLFIWEACKKVGSLTNTLDPGEMLKNVELNQGL